MDEELDVVVAGLKSAGSPFDDNVEGICAHCGVEVIWRPYMPEPSTKLCFACALKAMEEADEPPELTVLKDTREEIKNLKGEAHANAVEAELAKLKKLMKFSKRG